MHHLDAQTIDKFYGMKFRSSMDSVKKSMLAKPGCILNSKYSNQNILSFTGIKFADRKTLFMMFKFINKKLFMGVAVIRPENESVIVDLYYKIKAELSEKYYRADDFELYQPPFYKNDGKTLTAIKTNNVSFMSIFFMKKPDDNNKETQNGITLEITEDVNVKISYQDELLVIESNLQKKNKKMTDY